MKTVDKKLNKSQVAVISVLSASVILLVACIVLGIILPKLNKNNTGGTDLPQIQEGESIYLNQPIAYPSLEENEILDIEIEGKSGAYGLTRYPNDDGVFMFYYYEDGSKNPIPYMPPVYSETNDFSYESLYAIEQNDGYGRIYLVSYLCSALGAPYFAERIELPDASIPEENEKRTALLKEYGFSSGEYTTIYFSYGERDDKGTVKDDTKDSHVILIGKRAVSGTGFYFMVDGRNCVYYTKGDYFKYALAGFNEFVKGMLVSEGAAEESVFGPLLTTDFKNWVGTVYEKSEEKFGFDGADKLTDELLNKNPEVIVGVNKITPIDKGFDFTPEGEFNGYSSESTSILINFSDLLAQEEYDYFKAALSGVTVGGNKNIHVTVPSKIYANEEKRVDLSNGSALYKYTISRIESAISADGERTSGTVNDGDTYVKVTYRYSVGDKSTSYDTHALIRLSELSDESRAKLIGAEIGDDLGENKIVLDITYTKDNVSVSKEKFVLTGIVSIYDEKGQVQNEITDTSYVTISYYLVLGNVKSSTLTELVRVCDIKDDSKLAKLKTILPGKKKCELEEVVYDENYYYEFMKQFTSYEIKEVKFFVTNELKVSFNFVNASERDPFYGETYYENTLNNEYRIYGLNSGSCEGVVKFLGGIGTDSNSAVGFAGSTVAVGLTLENMEKYGLYAHRIYFEMPRGIFDVSTGDEDDDALGDYGWVYTLGFTLYISEVVDDPDSPGTAIRYIGSDMYDLVAKVPALGFEFLDKSFIEFWARRDMIAVDVNNLEEIKLDFNMEDLKGSYDFELGNSERYYGYLPDGTLDIRDDAADGYVSFDAQYVYVTPSEDAFDTELKRQLDKYGVSTQYSLAALYNNTQGGGNPTFSTSSTDFLGVATFKTVYNILIMTRYQDSISDEDKNFDEKNYIFKMSIKINDGDGDADDGDGYYTYKFYRVDDRRIMVSLYRTTDGDTRVEGAKEVSDFYVSTFAFKQLVSSYISLLNGEKIEGPGGYPSK